MGPEKHCSFYPVRKGTEFNLVLLYVYLILLEGVKEDTNLKLRNSVPDTLPQGTQTSRGTVQELEESFKGWDNT